MEFITAIEIQLKNPLTLAKLMMSRSNIREKKLRKEGEELSLAHKPQQKSRAYMQPSMKLNELYTFI